MKYILPLIFLSVIAYAVFGRVNVFAAYSRGVGNAIKFTLQLVPVLICVFIMCQLFEVSGLSAALTRALSPVFSALGVPQELTRLVLIKPFSGSGSLAFLTQVLSENGADSYISRCACVLYGSSETVFYIYAVYFARCRQKRRLIPVAIILFSTSLSTICACLLCRIM